MTPEQLSTIILAIFGVILQLAAKYLPKVSDWYQNHPDKGLIMLGAVVLIGLGYFGLACTPYGAQFGISLACTVDGAFLVLKAIFVVATAQSLTYLYTRK